MSWSRYCDKGTSVNCNGDGVGLEVDVIFNKHVVRRWLAFEHGFLNSAAPRTLKRRLAQSLLLHKSV